MAYNNYKYVIIDDSEVSSLDFSNIIETSSDTLRYNNDNSKTFVRFAGETPSFLEGKTQYTHAEFKSILNDPEDIWALDDTEQATLFNKLQDAVSDITWDKFNPFNWF